MSDSLTVRQQQRIEVRLQSIQYAAESIHLFEFAPLAPTQLPAFEPGSHVDLFLPGGLIRQYSIVSAPEQAQTYTLGIKRDPASRGGSRWLFEHARVGALFEISAPRNHFALADDDGASLLIAGGIGITPIFSMVRRLAAQQREWRLVYSVRQRVQAAFAEQLQRCHGARVALHVDDEQDGQMLDVPALVRSAPPGSHLYCCGPTPMLDAFEAAAADRDPAQVHLERFTAHTEAAVDGGFVVELARSARQVFVAQGQSIAQALQQAGIDVPVSCQQGICGTCETRVLAGIPDHRDALLSAQEKAANDVMMICCSGSKSASLVLDL